MFPTIIKIAFVTALISPSFSTEKQPDVSIKVQPGLNLVRLTGAPEKEAFKTLYTGPTEKFEDQFKKYANASVFNSGWWEGTFYLKDAQGSILGGIQIQCGGKKGMDFYAPQIEVPIGGNRVIFAVSPEKDGAYQSAFSEDVHQQVDGFVTTFSKILFSPFLKTMDGETGNRIFSALHAFYERTFPKLNVEHDGRKIDGVPFGGFLFISELWEGKVTDYSANLLRLYDLGCFSTIARFIPCQCCTGEGTWVAFFMTQKTILSYPEATRRYFQVETDISLSKLRPTLLSRAREYVTSITSQ